MAIKISTLDPKEVKSPAGAEKYTPKIEITFDCGAVWTWTHGHEHWTTRDAWAAGSEIASHLRKEASLLNDMKREQEVWNREI